MLTCQLGVPVTNADSADQTSPLEFVATKKLSLPFVPFVGLKMYADSGTSDECLWDVTVVEVVFNVNRQEFEVTASDCEFNDEGFWRMLDAAAANGWKLHSVVASVRDRIAVVAREQRQ